MPYLQFTHFPQPDEPKSENDRNECPKKATQYVYETKKNVIRILENIVNIQDKMAIMDVNCFEFCNQLSFEGGGCLKLITNDLRSYHR